MEVEELGSQPVVARVGRRPRLAPILAAVPVIALLAVGLGAFGGRHDTPLGDASRTAPSPAGSGVAAVPATPRPTPITTPTMPCQASTETVPAAYLSIDGTDSPPLFDEIDIGGLDEPGETPPEFGAIPDYRRIEVPSDARAFVGVAGDACALGWSIGLAENGRMTTLGLVRNPARDPLMAQQNRFDLPLALFRGADYSLVARLTYPTVIRQDVWPIRILPFDLPKAELRTDHRSADVDQGCDLELDLANGHHERVSNCADFSAVAPEPISVEQGASFDFGFGEGWLTQFNDLGCGKLEGGGFITSPTDCSVQQRSAGDAWSFEAPDVNGTWTLAIGACALQFVVNGVNQLCGTWYATIEVQA